MSIESVISQNEETVSGNFIIVIFICIWWNDVSRRNNRICKRMNPELKKFSARSSHNQHISVCIFSIEWTGDIQVTKYVHFFLVQILMEFIVQLCKDLKIGEILHRVQSTIKHHPFLTLVAAIIICILSLPFIIFIIFVVTTAVVTFTGFIFIEGGSDK